MNEDKIKELCVNTGIVSVYDLHCFSTEELIYKLLDLVNQVITGNSNLEALLKLKVNVSDMKDLYNFYDLNKKKDYQGSWWGIDKPQFSEPGIAGVVDKNVNDIKDLQNKVSDLTKYKSAYVDVTEMGIDNTGTTDTSNIFTDLYNQGYRNFYFPNGNYIGSYQIKTGCNILGIRPSYQNRTLINGTIFTSRLDLNNCNSVNIEGIGVNSQNDGIKIINNVSDILIHNCIFISKNHGFVAEGYGNACFNVIVDNCTAHDSIHGFVSKALNIKFLNCIADSCSYNGFVFCSDNMNDENDICNCSNNIVDNCIVNGNGVTTNGINIYAREYFKTDSTSIKLENLSFSNVQITNCTTAVILGEENISGDIKQVIQVRGCNFSNCLFKNNTNSFSFNNCNNTNITGGWISDKLLTTSKCANTFICNVSKIMNNVSDFVISDNQGAPKFDQCLNDRIVFKNTQSTSIFNLNSMEVGKRVHVLIDDEFTTINNSGNISVKAPITGKGSRATFYCTNEWKWQQE